MTDPSRLAVFPRLRSWAWVAFVAGIYFLLAMGSLWLTGQRSGVAIMWFANPVGAVALLALPVRRWLPMLGALALANMLANMLRMLVAQGGLAEGWSGSIASSAAAYAVGNCLEMALAGTLLKRLSLSPCALGHPDQLARVLLLGALVPTLVSACAGALALVLSGSEVNAFLPTWVTWFSGSVIGSVSVLPLALALWLQGGMQAGAVLRQARTMGFVLLCIAVTLLTATTLPHPFGVMVLPLVLLAARTDFLVTAMATALTAMILGGLIGSGVLVEPPSSTWWGPGLFYLSVLATLLPGLFLASSVQGRAAVMQQLSASEQRFRTLYTKTPTMMFSIDHRGCITSVSSLWLSTLGYTEQEVLGRPSVDFLTPESALRAREVLIPQNLRDGQCDNVAYQVVTRDGQILDVLLSSVWEYDDRGQPLQSLGVLQDVTEKNRLAARSHFAEHDPLTGLPNRVLLQDRLERSCLHHARQGGSFALGFVDLDNFKGINDTLGHDAGDLLLREVAQRLQSSLRTSDTVCRLGGDEFVLLFATIEDAQELMALANKVLAHVAQPCQLSSDPEAPVVTVSGSMGVAIFPDHGHDPSTLMRHADQAMYRAKHSGRNRCELFKPLD